MSHVEHHRLSEKIKDLSVSILTVSDSRTFENDSSGGYIESVLSGDGRVVIREIVRDNPEDIMEKALSLLESSELLIVTGGTGIAKRDNSVETLKKIVDREIPGFGELFRYLSYKEIGPSSYFSSSFAGIRDGKVIFVIPGSTGACKLAMERLILPELNHLIYELRK